jgi:hypothetical protein
MVAKLGMSFRVQHKFFGICSVTLLGANGPEVQRPRAKASLEFSYLSFSCKSLAVAQ